MITLLVREAAGHESGVVALNKTPSHERHGELSDLAGNQRRMEILTKTMEIMGLRIPAYFTDDPRLLYDYIVNFKTKSDDVFVVSYPKAG